VRPPVTVGNLGGSERAGFTVLGDVVNVASRLEEVTREIGGLIVTSEDCIRATGDSEWLTRFQSSRQVQLRSRQQGLLVHIAT
jgi:adenylate cyclase